MPPDETTGTSLTGRLTAAQKRLLREQARRREAERRREASRARDEQRQSETRDKNVTPARARPPVAGETAKDKVPVADPSTDRLRAVQAERNRKVAARPKPNVSTETGLMLNPALALAGLVAFGDPNIVRGARTTRRYARTALDTIRDPRASKKEKLEAALGTTAIAGGIGGAPSSGPKATPKPRDLKQLEEGTYKTRTVRYGQNETQFPASQSKLTRPVQRGLDRVSEKLAPKVDKLRVSDSRVKQAAGKALTLPSARRRVPVQAGKHVFKEGLRRKASAAQDISAIRDVGSRRLPGRKLEGDQLANFWYAQLPKTHRNAEGLSLVRGQLETEHQRLVSGEFGESVRGAMRGLRNDARKARAAGDTQAVFKAVGEIQQLRRIEADIPERIADVQENLNKLAKTIAKPPKADENALEGLARLSDETRDIYVRAGKLDPQVADERKGLVSRWVGLEPTGEEVYVGHRQGKVKGSRPSAMPGGVSTGKTKLPAGIAKKNRLVLAKSGRLRQDLRVAVEDWQAAQSYEFTNRAKDELATMGEPIVGKPKPGYVVINPRGHELPRTWKTDDEQRALAEGFDPDDVLVGDLEEYIGNVMAQTPGEAEKLMQRAAEAGHLKDLRQVPADVVNRYYSQFLPAKITVSTPGIKEGVSALSKGANLANDTLYLSLIYSNIGYIPSQVVANTGMAVAHQGAFFPVNFARATQVLTTGPKRLRDLLNAEHGQGASAAAPQTKSIQTITKPIAAVADDAFRLSSVLHELARLGVISKTNPRLSKADYATIEKALTDPRYRAAINDASDRATQSMVDFNRLGAKEAAIAKPAGFVWRWIRGGSRYPIRFAADHPLRTAAAAGAAYAGQDEIRELVADDLPPWFEGSLNAGTTEVDGTTYPRIFPTRSFSPISTPKETFDTLTGKKGARAIGEMVNPGFMAILRTAEKKNPYGGEEDSYRAAAKANFERLAPTPRFIGEVISPAEEPRNYPEDRTRWGRIKRQSRIFPFAVDPQAMLAARQRALGDVPPERFAYRKVFETRNQFFKAAQQAMPEALEDGKLPAKLRTAFNIEAERQALYARAAKGKDEGTVEYHQAKYRADLRLLVKHGLVTRKRADEVLAASAGATLEELKAARRAISERYYQGEGGQLYYISHARKALREKGVEIP